MVKSEYSQEHRHYSIWPFSVSAGTSSDRFISF